MAQPLSEVAAWPQAPTVEVNLLPGDANMDGTVDGKDFATLAANFTGSGGTGKTWSEGDFNHDGRVDGADFAILATDYGQAVTGGGYAMTVTGTAGDDDIQLSQVGRNVSVQADGQSWSFPGLDLHAVQADLGPGNDVFATAGAVQANLTVNGGDGNDTIYGGMGADHLNGQAGNDTIVSIGGGADMVLGGSGLDNLWVDSSDSFDADAQEVAGGYSHVVKQFYQPWTTDPSQPDYVPLDLLGQKLKDPAAGYAYKNFANVPLFSGTPQRTDIEQGYLGDCYFLATLASVAQVAPQDIRNSIVSLGDGTYAVRFYSGQKPEYVRVDADLPVLSNGSPAYARFGKSNTLWAPLMEKAWAFARYDSGSYADIASGWMGEVYAAVLDQGSNFVSTNADPNTVFADVVDALNQGQFVTIGSRSDASSPIEPDHAYAVVSAWTDDQGQQWVQIYNPYGRDGMGNDGDPSDGLITIPSTDLNTDFLALAVAGTA